MGESTMNIKQMLPYIYPSPFGECCDSNFTGLNGQHIIIFFFNRPQALPMMLLLSYNLKHAKKATISASCLETQSLITHLIMLEEQAMQAFFTKQHLLGAVFDIERAYDTAWQCGIHQTLNCWKLNGQLSNRQLQVWLGTVLLTSLTQENGILQGSSSLLYYFPLPSVESQVVYIGLSCASYILITSLSAADLNLF
jgi:hypothetical protein